MAQMSTAYPRELPGRVESLKEVGDVLTGEDNARPLLQACLSGNDKTLRSLLSRPIWIGTLLEKSNTIYSKMVLKGVPKVSAKPTFNIERCLTLAAVNGHAAVVSTLLAFAKSQGIDTSTFMTRSLINNAIGAGHAAVFKALASAEPNVINFPLGHGGTQPLYEAVRRREFEVAAVLLELGADPLHPANNDPNRRSLMSHAVFGGSRMIKMLIQHGTPVAGTGALHSAAKFEKLDIMRLLLQHDADANEIHTNWHNWTPMYFAASNGHVEAMKLLEEYGAHFGIQGRRWEDSRAAAGRQ